MKTAREQGTGPAGFDPWTGVRGAGDWSEFAVPLVVAVTGHRDLVPAEVPEIRARVSRMLAALRDAYPHRAVLVMSVEAARRLGVPEDRWVYLHGHADLRAQRLLERPDLLARANKRFHRQIHLASHNRYLVQQLEMVHRSMALVSNTTLAVDGRGPMALDEHEAVVRAIEAHDGDAADAAIRTHISRAFETRLTWDAERYA